MDQEKTAQPVKTVKKIVKKARKIYCAGCDKTIKLTKDNKCPKCGGMFVID